MVLIIEKMASIQHMGEKLKEKGISTSSVTAKGIAPPLGGIKPVAIGGKRRQK